MMVVLSWALLPSLWRKSNFYCAVPSSGWGEVARITSTVRPNRPAPLTTLQRSSLFYLLTLTRLTTPLYFLYLLSTPEQLRMGGGRCSVHLHGTPLPPCPVEDGGPLLGTPTIALARIQLLLRRP